MLILAFYEFIKIPLFQGWQLYILGEGPEKVYLEKKSLQSLILKIQFT